ncbi:hypothetical protein B0H11DRAFT_1331596 [Mycena galericulata]|nr:hypothetical protein B0H11DRAFT_1331596 [Mycena galericulata]
MSTPKSRMYEKRPKKPPACDNCKARRVLCHSQPKGASCPRCVEKNIVCTTTTVRRQGRPHKTAEANTSSPPPAATSQLASRLAPSCKAVLRPDLGSTGDCPELNPSFVSNCFACFNFISEYNHPFIIASNINKDIRAVSFQLHRLSPQSRVLALCIIALGSVLSFHESVLGEGPRPKSLADDVFLLSDPDVVGCGARRARVCRALPLRAEAVKAAWEIGIMFQPSTANGASCHLLDILEQTDFCGTWRPWASAYVTHIRALAPILRDENFTTTQAGIWAGVFMGDALISIRNRTPILLTLNDQLLLSGPGPSSLEQLLASLEASAGKPGLSVLWTSTTAYMFHIPCLARQLFDTINGDYARLTKLSEVAVINFLSSLSLLHSILSLLLDRIDEAVTSIREDSAPFYVGADNESLMRAAGCGIGLSFASLVLPFYYREVATRYASSDRMQLLCAQVRDMAGRGAHALARGYRYLHPLHYGPVHAAAVLTWAEWCVEDSEIDSQASLTPERVRDLATFATELKLLGYSLGGFFGTTGHRT